jgi:predicted secreted Zn-dependent protease
MSDTTKEFPDQPWVAADYAADIAPVEDVARHFVGGAAREVGAAGAAGAPREPTAAPRGLNGGRGRVSVLALQRRFGNAAVQRLLASDVTPTAQHEAVQRLAGGDLPVQRYAIGLKATASCDEVLGYIGAHSPYSPEAAHTKVTFTWTGDPVVAGAKPDYTVTYPAAVVTVTKKVDMPMWSPTGPMQAPWNAAWAKLRKHEGEHEAVGDKWKATLETNLRALSLTISASSPTAAKTEAKKQAEAEFKGWLPDHQKEQLALDPFEVIIDCPAEESD